MIIITACALSVPHLPKYVFQYDAPANINTSGHQAFRDVSAL